MAINLPLGCRLSDLPGNSPLDMEYQRFMEERLDNAQCEEFEDLLTRLGEEYGMEAPLLSLAGDIMAQVHKDPVARKAWENTLEAAWEKRRFGGFE